MPQLAALDPLLSVLPKRSTRGAVLVVGKVHRDLGLGETLVIPITIVTTDALCAVGPTGGVIAGPTFYVAKSAALGLQIPFSPCQLSRW